jgi:NADH:ubiquinone oxidoreductase subunit 6 (subunit J)
MKLLERRRAGYTQFVGVAIIAVILAVAMVVGVYVIGSIQSALPVSTLNDQANESVSKIFGTVYSAYQLLPILIIVVIAAAIIGAIFVFAGRSPTR